MTNEFKKITNGNETRFVLESATGGGTSAGAVGTGIAQPMGGIRRRAGDNLISQEGKKDRKDPIRVKSPVAKAHQSVGSGSGEHKNPKNTIPRKEKHKKQPALHEGAMDEIHADVGQLLGKYMDKYRSGLLDADHLMSLIDKCSAIVAKKFNIDQQHAQELVNQYVEQEVGGEQDYQASLEAKLAEKLSPQADVGDWVDDFKQADPNKYHQFRNKNDAKKQQMAVAAYMAAKDPNKHKR